jgi:hypothetical protein
MKPQSTDTGTYWLHIVEDKSPGAGFPSTYMLSLADAPQRNVPGGAVPMVHYHSWGRLRQNLLAVGMDDDTLRDAKRELDSKGSHTIQEAVLCQEQLERLGFKER